jgi:hypothetical protein
MMKSMCVLHVLWRRVFLFFALTTAVLLSSTGMADELQLLWQIAPGEQPFLATGNAERGVAYNQVTGHVLLVSRTDGLNVHILDGQTGAQLGTLNLGIVGGGTFGLSLIGVADDGVIYAANLTTGSTTSPFKVYRWENETAEPTIAYEGDPGEGQAPRWGDSFDVRGSGPNTQLVAGAGGTLTIGAIFTTQDGITFTSKIISNIAANSVSFGRGDSVWTKRSGAALREIGFNLATGVGTELRSVPTTLVPGAAVQLGVNGASNWLAIINLPTGVDDLRLYDISSPTLSLIDQENFPSDNANANTAGSVDLKRDIVVALDTNNGLIAYRVLKTVAPPAFATQPASITILEGGYATLRADVTGSAPFKFQWRLGDVEIVNATNSILLLSNVTPSHAGSYSLVVSNASASVTSSPAVVTVAPSTRSGRAILLWQLLPGSRPYITADGNTERGIAYNKKTGRLLVVSRAGGATNIYVLNGETGAELWKLRVPTDVVTTGTFPISMIGVADDGAVYSANLVTGGTGFKIYRWEDDTTNSVPTVAYEGSDGSGLRLGDTFDVRGSGNTTQLLAGHNQTVVADQPNPPAAFMLYTTTDGSNFTANRFEVVDAPSGSTRLGISFGGGNSIYAKSPAHPLRQFGFDLTAGTASSSNTYENINIAGTGPIAYDPVNKLIAGIANVNTTPNNVELYQFNDCFNGGCPPNPGLVDQDFFPTDNANANGTGAVDFGGGNLYALDTNNGLLALKINPAGPERATLSNPAVAGGNLTFTLTGTAAANYRIQSTTDFQAWTEVKTVTVGANSSVQVTDTAAGPRRFYRAVAP